MAKVLGLLANPGDTATMRSSFSPAFLAAVPPEKMTEVLTSLKAQAGACKDVTPVEVKDDLGVIFTLKCDHAALRGTLILGAAPSHLIEGLLFKPTP